MGSAFHVRCWAGAPGLAKHALHEGLDLLERLEADLSTFRPDSWISRINAAAGGETIAVPAHVHGLLQRCVELHHITQGAFDPTVGPLKDVYRFGKGRPASENAPGMEAPLPAPGQIREALALVDGSAIECLNGLRVRLPRAGMRIGLEAIGKGYAADRVVALWKELGVQGGVVNAAGDLAAFGRRPDGKAWTAVVPHPDAGPGHPMPELARFALLDRCLATSGDAEQHFHTSGRRWSHNLHPRTGLPLEGMRSVSVLSPSAELSDALATALGVLGPDVGLDLVAQMPQTGALMLDANGSMWSGGEWPSPEGET